MVDLCSEKKDAKVRKKAIAMIGEWGRSFEKHRDTLPIFSGTFRKLMSEGVQFPEGIKTSSPMFTPPSRSIVAEAVVREGSAATKSGSGTGAPKKDFLPTLVEDLNRVDAQLKLCKEMISSLPASGCEAVDDALLDGVDFLDQCTPRLQRVIKASVEGGATIPEKELGRLISTHEEVKRVVDDFVALEKCGFKRDKVDGDDAAAATKNTTADVPADEENILSAPAIATVAAPAVESDDPFGDIAPATATKISAAPAATSAAEGGGDADADTEVLLEGLFDS